MAYDTAEKAREHQRRYKAQDPEKWRRIGREWRQAHRAAAAAYSRAYREKRKAEGRPVVNDPEKKREYAQRPSTIAGRKAGYRRNLAASLFQLARQRAKRKGLPFAITVADIIVPEFCPVLGVKLEIGTGCMQRCSPTLDRVIPELGYVPGNVAVISLRANTMKQDATAAELRVLADWIDNHTRKP